MASEAEVLGFVVRGLEALTSDLDVGDISRGTVLRSLGVRSILLINFIAEIQDEYGLRNELLTTILTDSVPLDQRTVGELVLQVMSALGPRDS
jgi:hypothetical protein